MRTDEHNAAQTFMVICHLLPIMAERKFGHQRSVNTAHELRDD